MQILAHKTHQLELTFELRVKFFIKEKKTDLCRSAVIPVSCYYWGKMMNFLEKILKILLMEIEGTKVHEIF